MMLTMDRKTIRYPDGSVELKCSIDEAIMQLAEYEDTGRIPEEIDTLNQRLDENIGSSRMWRRRYYNLLAGKQNMTTQHIAELLSAEQNGHMVVLPCKVGDTVWSAEPFKDGKPRKGNIIQININADGFCGFWVSFNPEPVAAEFILEDIGKTVFRSRMEAEEVLGGDGE